MPKKIKRKAWKGNRRSRAKHARALAIAAPGGKGRIKKRKSYKRRV